MEFTVVVHHPHASHMYTVFADTEAEALAEAEQAAMHVGPTWIMDVECVNADFFA